MSADEKAYADLLSWQAMEMGRSFQITCNSGGVLVVLAGGGGVQAAVGSGADLTYASRAALADWDGRYPTSTPKDKK